jgi:hypothetical protein
VEYKTDDYKPATVNLSIQRSGAVDKTVLNEIITASNVKIISGKKNIAIKLKKPPNGENKNWVCKYLKTDTLTWDTLGCTTDKSGTSTITCECNHNSIYTAIEETTTDQAVTPEAATETTEPTSAQPTEEDDDEESVQTMWLGLWVYCTFIFSLIAMLPILYHRDSKDLSVISQTVHADRVMATATPKSGDSVKQDRKVATLGNLFNTDVVQVDESGASFLMKKPGPTQGRQKEAPSLFSNQLSEPNRRRP